jgi:hypothetical protein
VIRGVAGSPEQAATDELSRPASGSRASGRGSVPCLTPGTVRGTAAPARPTFTCSEIPMGTYDGTTKSGRGVVPFLWHSPPDRTGQHPPGPLKRLAIALKPRLTRLPSGGGSDSQSLRARLDSFGAASFIAENADGTSREHC